MPPHGHHPALPLAGVRVVVTRAAHQAGSTVRAFEEAGARVELLPLLEVVPPADPEPLDRALARLEDFSWVLFTSTNTVEQVLARLPADASAAVPEGVRIAAVGPSTGDALRERGFTPDLEATDARAEGLADLLGPCLTGGERVLLPQAADARPVLEELLLTAGALVTRVDAYDKRVPPESGERAREIFGAASAAGEIGWVTFTSPSIARNFFRLGEEVWRRDWPAARRGLLAVSIGPVTSAALRKLGVEPAAEAASPSDREMVEAVIGQIAARDRGRI